MFAWPYYELRDGWLVDVEDGQRCPFQKEPFPNGFTHHDAEAWLVRQDVRGSVRWEAA